MKDGTFDWGVAIKSNWVLDLEEAKVEIRRTGEILGGLVL